MVAKTQPSKKEWEEIEKSLSGPFGSVKFLIDGYKVTARTEAFKMKLVIIVFINGEFKGKWLTGDCEESRRFLWLKSSFVHSKKLRDRMKKPKNKAVYKELGWTADEKIHSTCPWFNSARSMRLHFIKNNESIQLVKL